MLRYGKNNATAMYELEKRVSKSICKIKCEIEKLLRRNFDQAVFVLNRSFLGKSNSTVKMRSRLIPVVATTLIRKSKKLPKLSHSNNTR